MGTFIEIQRDAFAANTDAVQSSLSQRKDFSSVRRPLRGIEIKDDTYGMLQILKQDGTKVPLVDAGGSIEGNTGATDANARKTHTYNYSNFIIQNIQESRQEKSQVLETFGDSYIFFFGERPRILQVSGLLMNTRDFNWRTEFWYNYENTLRGTKLVEQNARMYLSWDDIVVEGYLLQAQATDNAEMPYHIPFTFAMFVTNHAYLSAIGDDVYPISNAVVIDQLNLNRVTSSEDINKLKDLGDAADTKAGNAELVARRDFLISSETEGAVLAANAESTVSKLGIGKNLFLNALVLAVNASNLTFLSIVNHIYRDRVMRFPKGIAGAESYAGPPQRAGQLVPFAARPERTLPLRSKIRDNRDEYIGGSYPVSEVVDPYADGDSTLQSPQLMEAQALMDLAKAGANAIQHPGSSPLTNPFNIGVIATVAAYNIARFADGSFRGDPLEKRQFDPDTGETVGSVTL